MTFLQKKKVSLQSEYQENDKKMDNLIIGPNFFQINPEVNISTMDVFGHRILIADDLFTEECFENLQKATDNFPKTLFLDNHYSPNGKTYIDARTNIEFKQNFNLMNFIIKQVIENYHFYVSWYPHIVVNNFKLIKPPPDMIGNIPHNDYADFATLFFFDDVEGNGTAFYRMKTGIIEVPAAHEQVDTLVTMNNRFHNQSDYYFVKTDFEMFFDAMELIPAKKNRMLIYNGRLLHGAVHDNTMFTDEYRKTMVTFHSII